jgi:hypothetical protein
MSTNKSRKAGKWFSRYDLTITKIHKILGLVSAVSLLTTAIMLGGFLLLLVLFGVAAIAILLLAYLLDRSGFQSDELEERFEQQAKPLWVKQEQLDSSFVGLSTRMSDDELVEYVRYWAEQLNMDPMVRNGLVVVVERLKKQGKSAVILSKLLKSFEEGVKEDE